MTIVGAGLAGVECARAIIEGGFFVRLIDKKPERFGAYELPGFAELVCSNSLKSEADMTASGLLKREMRALGSLLLAKADNHRVRAGGALAVDREALSEEITAYLQAHPRVEVISKTVTSIPTDTAFTVIATGPLTEAPLATKISNDRLHFYDATAPIVAKESIDLNQAFAGGRYGKGGDDYLNCPLDEAAYHRFYEALVSGELVETDDYDDKLFQHCQPIERLARRGRDTIRYGPMRPVGLKDPQTGKRPFAVLQLRREDASGEMWGLVGFQTRLKFFEQKRIFQLIPALHRAEFYRYGVMHRNTYVQGPDMLTYGNEMKDRANVFVAGQLTGVEGYMESASSGLITGRFIRQLLAGKKKEEAIAALPSPDTMIGALHQYVIGSPTADYQPMNANFGLFPTADDQPRKKDLRRQYFIERSDAEIRRVLERDHD